MTVAYVYALCAVAYLALAALAATRWRAIAQGTGLSLALGVQAAWAAATSAYVFGAELPVVWAVGLEIARSIGWAAVLVSALAEVLDANLPRGWRGLAMAAAVTLPLLPVLAAFVLPAQDLLVALGGLQNWAGLLLAIAGLVLVEQFARNARSDLRWELRYLWLGIGILFAHDLALWSMALLGQAAGAIDSLRGVVNVAVAVLLAVSLRRLPGPLRASLLKRGGTLLFNTTLVVAGGYVLLMAAASLVLRQGGAGARPFVEVLFVGASLVLLAVAIFSSQFRAWWRVTLAKYLRPYRYDYRDVWLTLTRELSRSDEVPVRRRIARALAGFVDSGRGQLWERDEAVYRPVDAAADAGLPTSVPHDEFLEFLRRREWIFDLAAWREGSSAATPGARPAAGTSSVAMPPAPPAWLAADHDVWLVVPLLNDDEIVGFATLGRPFAPTRLGWEQLDLLRAAGRQIGGYLASDRAASRLAELHQFEAMNRLSGFVMHDLRHLVAQLALVVDNAARHRRNPEFIDDAILTIESSVQRMTGLMDSLRAGLGTEPERRVDLAELLREVVERNRLREPRPTLAAEAGPVEVVANRERLGASLEHLIRNAQDATPPTGQVAVTLRRESQSCAVEIADTGCGMDPEFVRNRLFKPFDSTKGAQGMGLGAFEARDIVRRLGGTLAVESAPGQGTTFRITLPLAPTVAR
ncbi:MAG: PEP-CTERM system histidine kinase PrsK [Steroidobacteraceae bacterium]|nr:PEP-CTERM system histidine kinase PrsK [Steroidobacteraceae bacterium]